MKLKIKKEGKRIIMLPFLAIFLIIISGIVVSLSFTSAPSLNSGDPVFTYTDLVCAWEQSGDVTSANVTWYKNGISQFTVIASGTSNTLLSPNTTKNDEWTCEVKLINSTAELLQNISANISNAPQTLPVLYDSAKIATIPTNYSLSEDISYTFYINSTDADLDVLTFGIEYDEVGICTLISSSTGEINCVVTHSKITGTSNSTPEIAVAKDFWPKARANNPGLSIFDDNRTFFLAPVNDQATFNQSVTNKSIYADTKWIIILNASDEENDFPLNFTFASNISNLFPGLMVLTAINNVTANLTFNTANNAPDNSHAGNWTIYLNVTDVNQSNSSRAPAQFSFNLEIKTTNHVPRFMTNFTTLNTTGNQTESYLIYINANDDDENDTLSFNVALPSSGCYDSFPWTISTTNSSHLNATGIINVTVLNNSHVACRTLNISVRDQHNATKSEIVTLNISNVNDAPTISEIGLNGLNMSSQPPIYKYSTYTYRINASDIDNKTYDVANTGILTYFTNETLLFPVNSTTGVISITINNNSYVNKNWTINLTAGDGFINVSRLMYLEILNNSAPALNLSNNNLTFYQNESIEINFTALERDNETMNISYSSLTTFNTSKYNITNKSRVYADGNLELWLLNMTNNNSRLANDNVGNHRIQINISDYPGGASEENISTGVLNFTILNINDAPFFDSNKDNISDNIEFGNLTINITAWFTLNVTDYDLLLSSQYANDVLTFSYSNISNAISSNISLTKTSNNTALLYFTPNETGNFSITLNVTDSNGTYHNQTVNFQVLLPTSKPLFEQIKPYLNSTTRLTIDNFTTASSYSNNITEVNVSENQTWTFDAIISNDTSYPNNDMTIKWYVDRVLNKTITSYANNYSNLTYEFGFFSNRTMNITMEATDLRSSASNWTWMINITNVNRPPGLNTSLPAIENISGTTIITDYFTKGENNTVRFYDYDLTQLNYTMNYVSPTSGCSVFSFSSSANSITITPLISDGVCIVNFTATDDYGAKVDSNDVTISVEGYVPSSGTTTTSSQSGGSSTRTQIITVPFEEQVDKPVPIKIVAPGTVSTYANRTIEIPITLKNTWEEDIQGVALSGVALNASLADEPNVTIQFSESYFSTIPFGGESSTVLTISNYRKEGPFEITVFARVSNPDFTDSATILINSLEQSSIGDDVKSKVTFAKDMLADNPECRELNELLDRADAAIVRGNYADAVNLVDAVINGCKFLINQKEEVRRETPSILQTGFAFAEKYSLEIIYGSALILILTLILYAVAAVKKKISEIK